MGKPSKKDKILELFFSQPSKQWHFKDIASQAGISQDRANHWLKQMVKENLIKHMKPDRKMPFFIAYFEHPNYKNSKKIFTLKKLHEAGFLAHLQGLDAKAIVLFGSFARSDWHAKSDIDLFILGDDADFEKGRFEKRLRREIEIFSAKTRKDIKKINPDLINNILNGYFIKGEVQDITGREYGEQSDSGRGL